MTVTRSVVFDPSGGVTSAVSEKFGYDGGGGDVQESNYAPTFAKFSGTNYQSLTFNPGTLGISNNDNFVMSIWFTAETASTKYMVSVGESGAGPLDGALIVQTRADSLSGAVIRVKGSSASPLDWLADELVKDRVIKDHLCHLLVSYDGSTGKAVMNLMDSGTGPDGAALASPDDLTVSAAQTSGAAWEDCDIIRIGAALNGAAGMTGFVGDVWMQWGGTALTNPMSAEEIAKFRTSDGLPVDPGATGLGYGMGAPHVFLGGTDYTVAEFEAGVNLGSAGGTFTATGSFGTGLEQDPPQVQREHDGHTTQFGSLSDDGVYSYRLNGLTSILHYTNSAGTPTTPTTLLYEDTTTPHLGQLLNGAGAAHTLPKIRYAHEATNGVLLFLVEEFDAAQGYDSQDTSKNKTKYFMYAMDGAGGSALVADPTTPVLWCGSTGGLSGDHVQGARCLGADNFINVTINATAYVIFCEYNTVSSSTTDLNGIDICSAWIAAESDLTSWSKFWSMNQVEESGTATSGTTTVLTDTGASFTVDGLIGKTIKNLTQGESALISDNDGTTITHAAMSAWSASDEYRVIFHNGRHFHGMFQSPYPETLGGTDLPIGAMVGDSSTQHMTVLGLGASDQTSWDSLIAGSTYAEIEAHADFETYSGREELSDPLDTDFYQRNKAIQVISKMGYHYWYPDSDNATNVVRGMYRASHDFGDKAVRVHFPDHQNPAKSTFIDGELYGGGMWQSASGVLYACEFFESAHAGNKMRIYASTNGIRWQEVGYFLVTPTGTRSAMWTQSDAADQMWINGQDTLAFQKDTATGIGAVISETSATVTSSVKLNS